MQSFKSMVENSDDVISAAKKKLQRMKKGSKVSFTHSQTGKDHTGEYRGLKNMHGYSYAHVEHPKGVNAPNFIPVHHIHQAGAKKGVKM